ncbi:hypothetical protein [Asticcacaulis tiandongensis]|uniref:hypothetical protein n=1 Tax=Asticcacaulis tiandongensis TaxID=2565365 RepID=UPI001128C957|nr:hypothetical protein [Asticcacaulis tiandongensis]
MNFAIGASQPVSKKRFWLRLSAGVVTLAMVAACKTVEPPPPPPPPPAPAGPPVSLSPHVSDAASIYVTYVNLARNMGSGLADGQAVATRLQEGASYEPTQMATGAVAYGAIVAMQEPAFRSQLRGYASDEATRREMVDRLIRDPSYAASIPGANIAARRVILALSSDGEAIYKKGAEFKQAAYSIQKEKWAKGVVTGPAERLAATKLASSTKQSVFADESAHLMASALSGQGLKTYASTGALSAEASAYDAGTATTPAPVADQLVTTAATPGAFAREDLFTTPYTAGVNRSLAIAALSILGEGTGANEEAIQAMLNDGHSSRCLNESKLNLNQCLAASRFHFDDVFCVGQHILMDTGNCIGELSSNALDLSPKRQVALNADGTEAMKYANAKPYIQPAKPAARKTAAKKKK